MKILCKCGRDYSTRQSPLADGEDNILACRTDRSSYGCPDCGEFNAPRLSEGARFEVGVGTFNLGSILRLDLYSGERS
jgi:hypothetical protein